MTGFSRSNETGWDYATIRYDADGTERWVRRYGEPGSGSDRANALVVGPAISGLCFVTGESRGADTRTDYATVCYSTADGTERWVRRYDGPDHFEDSAVAMAVDDARQRIYVTGSSFSVDAGSDYATVCYDFDGNQLWAKRYDGPRNRDDNATAIAVSPNGDVCVTGDSRGRGWDYATVCYDPNGNEFWVRRYEGAGDDRARALAVDSGGNLVVTGSTTIEESGYTHTNFATLSYDPIGVERWVATYDGTGHGADAAVALVIDGADNVYVTGESFGDVGGMDYATVKYATRAGSPAEQTQTQCQALAATTGESFRAAEAAAAASRAVTSLGAALGAVESATEAYSAAESAAQQRATEADILASRASANIGGALRTAEDARQASTIVAVNAPPGGAEEAATEATRAAQHATETITAVETAETALQATRAALAVDSPPGAVTEAANALTAAQQAAVTAQTTVQASTAAQTAAQRAAQDAECP